MNDQVTHPTPDVLNAFSLGQLGAEDAVAVEEHLGDCGPCCETLLGLSSDDTFVALLQEANQPPTNETLELLSESHASKSVAGVPPSLADHPRYAIVAPVGKGGMGDVFKAEHRMMERTVALKVIKGELFRNPAAVERFHREVKSAASLSHANIVTAHDAEQVGDVNFLVMEYVEGVDLACRVKEEGALPVNEACQYIFQAALGLQHAHEQGMVHRDIKPHNLMVTSDGTLKILDFGLATLATEAVTSEVNDERSDDSSPTSPTLRLTTMGTMMGTPDFISPEQASNPHAVDVRSDIYSLGCTFYYLLSGRPPFATGAVMEKVKAHSDQLATPIENVRPDIPEEVAHVVRRMLAKEPGERFQTPADVADVLAPLVDAHRTTLPAADTTASRGSWWPPTITRTLAGAAFAIVFSIIISVATDQGTLEIRSADESIQVNVRPVASDPKVADANLSNAELDITDTITGSTARRLRSGEYVLDIKGDKNTYELDKERFVLKRGETVVVAVKKVEKNAPKPELTLLPEPWVDGESLQYEVKLASGLHVGRFVFSVSASRESSRDIWLAKVGRYFVFRGVQAFGTASADRNTFQPISSTFRHPVLGSFEAAYDHDKVIIKTTNREDGKEHIRTTELDGIHYDTEQMVELIRRLPLTKDFKQKVPVLATFGDGPLEIEAEVTGLETIEVPAGRFDCFKLKMMTETYWISNDVHRYPVKFESSGLTGTLDTIRVNKPGELVTHRDDKVGFSISAPADWYIDVEAHDDKEEVSFHLLDPHADALSELVAAPSGKLKEWLTTRISDQQEVSARAWLELGIKRRKETRKNFTVRPDSWEDRTISGNHAVSYIADYVEQDKAMVHYAVCSLGKSTALQFKTRIEKDRFEDFKDAFDKIAESYNEDPE